MNNRDARTKETATQETTRQGLPAGSSSSWSASQPGRFRFGMGGPASATTTIPWLLPEGDHKGHLEYVTFIATDGIETYKWSTTNTGTYVQDFALILDAGNAPHILDELRRGNTVLFSGLFELDQVVHQFGGASND